MQDTWVRVRGADDVRLEVRVVRPGVPEAPTLMLHHGLASSQRIWDLMVPRLARRFREVTYDARGHGRSSKPTSGYGFERVVGDARAVIRATRAGRPIVVGHSWGAMVALELAARHPRSVAGAVLVDGGIAPLGARMSWAQTKAQLAPPRLAGIHVEEFRAMIRTFFADAIEVSPDVESIVMSLMRVGRDGRIRPHLSRANHFRILRAVWQQDPVALHARLRVPALAILAHRSGDDRETGREDDKRLAVRQLREVGAPTRVTWLEGIHDLPLQHPEALCRRIERFAAAAVG